MLQCSTQRLQDSQQSTGQRECSEIVIMIERGRLQNDGLPCSLYQLAVERALAEQKAPIEERKMPQFDSDAEAEAYFEVLKGHDEL